MNAQDNCDNCDKFCIRVEKRKKEFESLLKATKYILKFNKFEDAAQNIFNACKEEIGAKSGYVALLSKDGSENEVLFLDSGGLPCSVDKNLPMPIRGLRGEAYKKGKVVFENNFMKSEWIKFMPKGHVILNNVLFAPLNIEGKTIGIIGIANKNGGFNKEDAKKAEAFGELAAIALYNSRIIDTLENSEKKYHDAYDLVDFYKDLFAHDISNILQNIRSSVDLFNLKMKNSNATIKIEDLFEIMEDQISRGSTLIKNVRKLSKIDEKDIQLKNYNVIEVINSVIKYLRKTYKNKELRIKFSPEFQKIEVLADDFLLDLFENILINSVKHNENEIIELEISIKREIINKKNYIKLEFIDNGIGIPDLLKKQILEGDYTKRDDSRGMGIGLRLIKKLCNLYKADILIEDKIPGNYSKGTNFIIIFEEAI